MLRAYGLTADLEFMPSHARAARSNNSTTYRAISIEIPSESRAPVVGYSEWARRATAAARDVLGARASGR